MTIRQAFTQAIAKLEAAGVPDARTDASLLLADITGLSRLSLSLRESQPLNLEQEQRFASLLLSRVSRKPLQYLLGTQWFYGLPFQVDERVLIPRPETETLCEVALAHLSSLASPTVLDLCTGSGAIAITLKHECPAATVTAADISAAALSLAQENARSHQTSIRFLQGDLFSPVTGEQFDCIVSNPPYIQTDHCATLQAEVLFEPVLALDGGADGLDFYRNIAVQAPAHLSPGGFLCLEVGDFQGQAVAALLAAQACFASITLHKDLGGTERVVCAQA